MNIPQIENASVKVMRSHDYCHFEVSLSSTLANTPELVDELRKVAARLADKAVDQYRISKVNAARLLNEKQSRKYVVDQIKHIRDMPEFERTVGDQAKLKAFDDATWEANRRYNYDDDWQDD